MSKNVGLITYHSAYNFGSMLQSYATQQAVLGLGHNCTIVNYRMREQRQYYELLRYRYGLKKTVADLLMLPKYKERRLANARYEAFLQDRLLLTDACEDPLDAINQLAEFEVAISGSDQIWNKHSFELEHADWGYMLPYLLADYDGRKISYASSVGGTTGNELKKIARYIDSFDCLSVRETMSRYALRELLHRDISEVLDPTFLLDSEGWSSRFDLKETDAKPYVLYYTVRGYSYNIGRMKALKQFAEERGCELRMFTPAMYLPTPMHGVKSFHDYGPAEFLNALYGAHCVISESYHGTVLAINFNKDVYSICGSGGAEYRKTDILNKLDMSDRIVSDVSELRAKHKDIEYDSVNERIALLRKQSLDYLAQAIQG